MSAQQRQQRRSVGWARPPWCSLTCRDAPSLLRLSPCSVTAVSPANQPATDTRMVASSPPGLAAIADRHRLCSGCQQCRDLRGRLILVRGQRWPSIRLPGHRRTAGNCCSVFRCVFAAAHFAVAQTFQDIGMSVGVALHVRREHLIQPPAAVSNAPLRCSVSLSLLAAPSRMLFTMTSSW